MRLDWCGYGCKPSAAGLVRLGLQTSAELLRMYKFNQKIVVNKVIANNQKKEIQHNLSNIPGAANLGCWTGAVMAANHQQLD